MRLKSITATVLISACVLPLLLAARRLARDDIQLQENRPDRYTVQKGDTLWGIAGKFLKQPWRWPEVWRMNRDQIKNPHWIYPGDVIALDKIDGQWRLSVASSGTRPDIRVSPTVRIDPLEAQAIPSIPPGDLAPYLTQPIITGSDGLPGAAKIIAARDNRVVRGEGDFVYAVGIDEKAGTQWYIYRPGNVLRSFDSNETLGYEMRYLGTARVERFGEVSRMLITSAREEILINDLLVPAPRETLVNYVPHAPDTAVDGRVIELYSGGAEAGRGFIVILDRGTPGRPRDRERAGGLSSVAGDHRIHVPTKGPMSSPSCGSRRTLSCLRPSISTYLPNARACCSSSACSTASPTRSCSIPPSRS